LLKIDEAEFMAATQATFKLGIKFENWRGIDEEYMHAFGDTGKDCWAGGFQHFWKKGLAKGYSEDYGKYCLEAVVAEQKKFTHLPKQQQQFAYLPQKQPNHAYHLDAILYAKYLRKLSEKAGVTRIEGKIVSVNLNDDGFITSLDMQSGQTIDGDLFIDCTDQKAVLIEGAMHTGYEDWSHWLACDSAVAVQTKNIKPASPYTRSIAFEAGWQWRIPLQSRMGNGIVYSSNYMTAEDAEKRLLDSVEGEVITKPLHVKYNIGQRLKHWNKNCVAIGLASGFIEPLESTALHLIYTGITKLLTLFPNDGIRESDIDQYNKQRKFEADRIRDFIILHYKVTNRDDSELWRHSRRMSIPDSLTQKIEQFKGSGNVFYEGNELFTDSWQQVMVGQGLVPETYHKIVDEMSDEDLKGFLQSLKNNVDKKASAMCAHEEYIAKYCQAPADC
jgi:tryptophan halogenase